LVFCTAFAESQERWDRRYRRWLRAIQESHLEHDSILLVDDGSPVLPDWSGLDIRPADLRDVGAFDKPVLSHFSERLGRSAVFDFPGWYRSFAYAGQFAARYGFEKIVHVESDSFLIGRRIHQYVNNAPAGWTALWCPRHGIPEAAIQIMVDDAVQRFAAIPDTHPHHRLLGQEFELQLPFDFVERGFVGDRYGEYLSFIPGNAEYAVQVQDDLPQSACWWLTPIADAHPYTNGQDARSGDISKYRSCRPSITSAQYGL